MSRLTKQQRLDREAAEKLVNGLNDFLSLVNDVSNETGFDVPEPHHSNLMALHKELMDKMLGD